MPPAIEVEGVTKRFRLYRERNQSLKQALLRRQRARFEEFTALDDVSFDVPEGSTFGLIGENGSGKSTLLKCIARILRPDSGRVHAVGRVSALLELGAGFHPELSGRENVYLNGSILGLTKRDLDRRFDEIVAFAGLERFIDAPVKTYSSGMYVRLGFSVAINVDPDVLLVDEVLAVGDEQFQHACHEKFADLKRRGRTVLLVSHALEAVRSVCDHAAWLQDGALRAVGPAGTVVDDYIDEVHADRAGGESKGARWGSGEARIDRFEVLGPGGVPVGRIRTGDALSVRLHFVADEVVERPVFCLSVHTLEGLHVSGPNTRDAGLVPDLIEGAGSVDLDIPCLLLMPGAYDVSVAITDFSLMHVFDFRHRMWRLEVEPGTPRESYGGLVSLGGAWRMSEVSPAPRRG